MTIVLSVIRVKASDYSFGSFSLTANFGSNGSCWQSWIHHFESFMIATMIWLTATEYVCYRWPGICSICPPEQQELQTFHERMSSLPVFSAINYSRR